MAATGQNVGKTTLCLGMISGFRKHYPRLGFIKPVGQQHQKVDGGLLVDKDVVLFKEYFHLPSNYADMSPVIFPQGFTRDFIDGKVSRDDLVARIRKSYETISKANDFTLVEGTGHVGVGSIVDLNNAQVARELGLNVVLIAEGGLGSAFDQLALNRALCLKMGLNVSGVILNRVLDQKREMVIDYMTRALAPLDIPLIGAIPYNKLLSTPSMQDFEALFKTYLLAGEDFHYRHFTSMRLVATSAKMFAEVVGHDELIVTPATREDIIHVLLQRDKDTRKEEPEYGLILTGRYPPEKELIEKLKRAKIPTLYCAYPTFDVMLMINTYTAKTQKEDVKKIKMAIDIVESHLDFNLLMQAAD